MVLKTQKKKYTKMFQQKYTKFFTQKKEKSFAETMISYLADIRIGIKNLKVTAKRRTKKPIAKKSDKHSIKKIKHERIKHTNAKKLKKDKRNTCQTGGWCLNYRIKKDRVHFVKSRKFKHKVKKVAKQQKIRRAKFFKKHSKYTTYKIRRAKFFTKHSKYTTYKKNKRTKRHYLNDIFNYNKKRRRLEYRCNKVNKFETINKRLVNMPTIKCFLLLQKDQKFHKPIMLTGTYKRFLLLKIFLKTFLLLKKNTIAITIKNLYFIMKITRNLLLNMFLFKRKKFSLKFTKFLNMIILRENTVIKSNAYFFKFIFQRRFLLYAGASSAY